MIRFVKYLYFSNLITSISGAIFSYGINYKLEIKGADWYSFFIFFAILSTYTYQRWRRYIQLINKKSEHIEWINSNKRVHFIVLILGLIGSLTFIFLHYDSFIKIFPALLIPTIICLWYVHPIFGVILREVPYIKSFLIVFTWITLLLWIPIYLFDAVFLDGLHLTIILFFFLFGILLLFDLRDIEYDFKKIKTFPILVGERYAKILAIYCFLFVGFYGLFTNYLNFLECIPVILLVCLVFYARSKGPSMYFACLDLMLAIQGLFYVWFH